MMSNFTNWLHSRHHIRGQCSRDFIDGSRRYRICHHRIATRFLFWFQHEISWHLRRRSRRSNLLRFWSSFFPRIRSCRSRNRFLFDRWRRCWCWCWCRWFTLLIQVRPCWWRRRWSSSSLWWRSWEFNRLKKRRFLRLQVPVGSKKSF